MYLQFCQYYGLRPLPADEWQYIRFARYLANYVTSYNTVLNYLSTVRKLHKIGGYPVVEPGAPNLDMFLRGVKAELANPTRQSKPVTPKILWKIYQVIDTTNKIHVVAYTALLLGFYLFLRSSNLVPQSAAGFQAGVQLAREHVKHWKGLVLIEIHWSKTIQYKQKILTLPLIPAAVRQVCPVFWVKHMCSLVTAGPTEPLFSVPSGEGNKALTYDQLRKIFAEWITAIGLSPVDYTLHGLRRGGTSWGLQAGLTGPEIQVMGDWASLAYLRYLDTDLEGRVKSMVQFVEQVDLVLF